MKLRPHHALCTQFFVGKGYSEQFVNHMFRVLAELNREGAIVTLTEECDEICAACPNNRSGSCETALKVAAIDHRVMEALNLKPGDTLHWKDLCALARRDIIEPGRLLEICADCEWIGICSR